MQARQSQDSCILPLLSFSANMDLAAARREPRDSQESAADRMEQLADAGRIDPAANDYATFRERADASALPDARDSEPLPW